MAGVAERGVRVPSLVGWYERLEALLARELAPTSRKVKTALRFSTIATVAAGLIVSCHVYNQFGTYIVWLLVGAGPMMSASKALKFLFANALALIGAVMMARLLVDTPWLMLPWLFVLLTISTYIGNALKLGAYLLLLEVLSLAAYYDVVFASGDIGWQAAGAFGGTAINLGILVLFDNWLWPDPAEGILMRALGASVARARVRFLAASRYYLDGRVPKPREPPPTSDLPAHIGLLDQAGAEGILARRHAILLAAVTRVALIEGEVARITVTVRENAGRQIREMVRPEIEAAIDAIAAALENLAQQLPTYIAVGPDEPPPLPRKLAREATDKLSARINQIRPEYIGKATRAEVANFGSFAQSLTTLTSFIERLLDQPPQTPEEPVPNVVATLTAALDPTLARYSVKVGLAVVIGYTIGLASHRPELTTILTTVLITALPNYGAAVHKMILRIVGAAIGGVISLGVIIIVSPNFSTVPAYMIAVFVVFYLSGYCSLSSGRIAYAGKQIGTTFALVFTGLSPTPDIYTPLWRIWSILLGTLIAAIIGLLVWPEYAGDSLLPRLRKVILDTLALVPGGSATSSEEKINAVNSETMSTLAEMLSVADDAQLEGRSSLVDHNAIIEATGRLRRIANRLSWIGSGRIDVPLPELDAATESARAAFFVAIRRQLESWLESLSVPEGISAHAFRASAEALSRQNLGLLVEQFGSLVEEQNFARLNSWTLDQRRTLLAELQSMQRLAILFPDLNRWFAQIPGPATTTALRSIPMRC